MKPVTATAASRPRKGRRPSFDELVARFDHDAFDLPGRRAVIRLAATGGSSRDVVVEPDRAWLEPERGGDPDALLSADPATWDQIARDVGSGMEAFRRGRLQIRRNLHLGT